MIMIKIETLTDLRKLYKGHFFDEGWNNYFHTHYSEKIYKERFFITSEQFDDESDRLYTVREFTIGDDGTIDIDTVGSFQQFSTLREAENFVEDERGECI